MSSFEHDPTISDVDTKEEPTKIFVGQVPRQITEIDLKKIFEPFGVITETTILRDRLTGTHKGCAFLTFTSRANAEKAIESLHNKVTLHHTKRPMQVRLAGKEHEPKGDVKLFVGMLSKSSTESTIMELFSAYGRVKEVYLMKDSNGKSKGCAFIKMESRLEAQKAIAGLHDTYQDEGAPRKLTVKYADTKEERTHRQMAKHFQGFAPFAAGGLGGGRGLGLPAPGGMGFPGVGMGGLGAPGFSGAPGFPTPGFGTPGFMGSGVAGLYGGSGGASEFGGAPPASQTRGPPGANLFIYNVPDAFTDSDLQSMFSNFGNVLSALVFKDKVTGLSRGFGFVSYDSPSSAEKAIVALNGFHVGNKRLKVMLKKNGGGLNGGGGTTSSSSGRGFAPY